MTGPETFMLELLPARGLDQSMLLPVLVGLLVVLFFTETLGWVFAGAVVPGYLASVLIIQPVTGVIVIFESLLTLATAVVLAKVLSRTDAWTRFFGRERFFLILAISLIVRIHDHSWFAPWAIGVIDEWVGTGFSTQQEFYSVGLVLVPLTANMLWKPAMHRGFMQLGVQLAITYLIVLYVLLPYTNLSLSSVELTYENTAINFVGHAKAHIILLTAALLAAQFNLTYGWDFNGILVPALLALLWLTPLKLVATISEAIVVLYLVRGFLRLPVIRHLDIAGPRKIVLVFTIAFAWKVALGFALAPVFPELKISDTYGFGYLLSSLLAVKMLGLKSVRAVLLPTLMASAGGFLIGSIVGFLLNMAAPVIPPQDTITRPTSQRLASTPLGIVTLARMQIEVTHDQPQAPTQAELHQLQLFWAEVAQLDLTLDSDRETGLERMIASFSPELGAELGDAFARAEPPRLEPMRRRGAQLGLQIVELGEYPVGLEFEQLREWFGIVEQGGSARRGFATGLVSPEGRGPVLVVTMPASEAPVGEAAVLACRRVDCRAVLVAGRELAEAGTRIQPRPVEIAVAAFEAKQVVTMRADVDVDRTTRVASQFSPVSTFEPTPTRIHPLRGHFDLVELWPDYALDWQPRETLIRPPPGDGDFVLLRTTHAQLEAMLVEGVHELEITTAAERLRRQRDRHRSKPGESELLGILAEMQANREPPGLAGSGYEPPSDSELLLLERDIVQPLVKWAKNSGPGVPPPASVALWAAEIDYELIEFGDCRSTAVGGGYRPCLVMLRERDRPSTAGWGTLVVRRDPQAIPLTIEVPHPHRELQTWRVGVELWLLSRASELLIAGADSRPHEPREALTEDVQSNDVQRTVANPDPVRSGNLGTPFQAIHQGIDRSSVRGRTREVVQIRGLAAFRALDHDLILGIGQPGKAEQYDEACWAKLDDSLAALISTWGSCQIADGSEDLYVLTGAGSPQLEYSRELRSREIRVLWLSAAVRERFAPDHGAGTIRGLAQAGFDHELRREVQVLLAPVWGPQPSRGPDGKVRRMAGAQGFDAAIELAVEFAETGNLHLLRELRALAETSADLRIETGIGQDWGRAFVLIERPGETVGERALVSLDHGLDGRVQLLATGRSKHAIMRVHTAALGRPQVLIVTGLPVIGGTR